MLHGALILRDDLETPIFLQLDRVELHEAFVGGLARTYLIGLLSELLLRICD